MNKNIKFDKNENCFIVNEIIKVDSEYVNNLSIKRNLDNLIKKDELYYYKNKSLIDLLFNITNYKQIIFKNNNNNDYRFDNLNIILNDLIVINEPNNVIILETGTTKLITCGAHSGEERNLYWKVKDENKEYYMMHIKDDLYTKFSIQDIKKILNYNNSRPCWYLNNNGYIGTTLKINNERKSIYLHQYILDIHFEDNTSMDKTVDHINRDKLDNRRENLHFANMTEQNLNKDKQKRQKNACPLPDGILQTDLPKHVTYNKRCYDKENNSWREFFQIENHPKLEGVFASSKSNKVSIQEKLKEILFKLKELNGEITEEEFKSESEPEYTLPKGFRCSINKITNKYMLICDRRNPSINLKMTLTNNNLQLMLNQFIDQINMKYLKKDENFVKLEYFTLEKNIILNFTNENEEKIIIENEKYQVKPDLPEHVSLYKEKDNWCLGYAKTINKIRHSKRFFMNTMNIQTELDRLIDEVNKEYPNLNLQKYNVKNPMDFTDNTFLRKQSTKPKMPNNFSVLTMNQKDYIQFNKKINGKRYSYKTTIKSDDLQKELDTFVDYLNDTYNLNLTKNLILI